MSELDPSRRSFLQHSVALAGSAPLLGALLDARVAAAGLPLMAYVGTFSSPLRDVLSTQVDLPPGNGRGIHLFRVDPATGVMTPAGVCENATSPTSLVINRAGDRLYCSNETDRVGSDKQGTVSAYAIDRSDGSLSLLNTVRSGGAGPTHASLHPSGRHLLVANYFGGSVAVLPVAADGRLGDATDVKTDVGKIGSTRATHAPPGSFAFSGHDRTHAHMIAADPSGKFVLHTDLGLDRLYVWTFDEGKGLLVPAEAPTIALPAGDGPRRFQFHPNGRVLYCLLEESSTLASFDYAVDSGRLTPRQTLSTLPPGFAGSSFASELLIGPGGRFIYAGNRLHDSIAIFSIGPGGDLTYIGEEWTRGNYPRSFSFDPAARFLYCCNQRGDNVTSFAMDATSGGLNFTGHYTPVGNPSSIVFLELGKPE